MREVTVESPDVATARERWERLLGPPDRDPDHWTLNGGPALRLIEGPRDQLGALTLEVRSLSRVRDHLAAQNLIATDTPNELTIAPAQAGSLSLRVVAQPAQEATSA